MNNHRITKSTNNMIKQQGKKVLLQLQEIGNCMFIISYDFGMLILLSGCVVVVTTFLVEPE